MMNDELSASNTTTSSDSPSSPDSLTKEILQDKVLRALEQYCLESEQDVDKQEKKEGETTEEEKERITKEEEAKEEARVNRLAVKALLEAVFEAQIRDPNEAQELNLKSNNDIADTAIYANSIKNLPVGILDYLKIKNITIPEGLRETPRWLIELNPVNKIEKVTILNYLGSKLDLKKLEANEIEVKDAAELKMLNALAGTKILASVNNHIHGPYPNKVSVILYDKEGNRLGKSTATNRIYYSGQKAQNETRLRNVNGKASFPPPNASQKIVCRHIVIKEAKDGRANHRKKLFFKKKKLFIENNKLFVEKNKLFLEKKNASAEEADALVKEKNALAEEEKALAKEMTALKKEGGPLFKSRFDHRKDNMGLPSSMISHVPASTEEIFQKVDHYAPENTVTGLEQLGKIFSEKFRKMKPDDMEDFVVRTHNHAMRFKLEIKEPSAGEPGLRGIVDFYDPNRTLISARGVFYIGGDPNAKNLENHDFSYVESLNFNCFLRPAERNSYLNIPLKNDQLNTTQSVDPSIGQAIILIKLPKDLENISITEERKFYFVLSDKEKDSALYYYYLLSIGAPLDELKSQLGRLENCKTSEERMTFLKAKGHDANAHTGISEAIYRNHDHTVKKWGQLVLDEYIEGRLDKNNVKELFTFIPREFLKDNKEELKQMKDAPDSNRTFHHAFISSKPNVFKEMGELLLEARKMDILSNEELADLLSIRSKSEVRKLNFEKNLENYPQNIKVFGDFLIKAHQEKWLGTEQVKELLVAQQFNSSLFDDMRESNHDESTKAFLDTLIKLHEKGVLKDSEVVDVLGVENDKDNSIILEKLKQNNLQVNDVLGCSFKNKNNDAPNEVQETGEVKLIKELEKHILVKSHQTTLVEANILETSKIIDALNAKIKEMQDEKTPAQRVTALDTTQQTELKEKLAIGIVVLEMKGRGMELLQAATAPALRGSTLFSGQQPKPELEHAQVNSSEVSGTLKENKRTIKKC